MYRQQEGQLIPTVLATITTILSRQSSIAFKGGAQQPSHAIAHELETSPETCNCVAASGNGQLLAAAFGKNVRIYASNPSGFHQLAEVEVSETQ